RMTRIGDLKGAVLALDRAQLRASSAFADLRRPCARQWRPDLGAGAVAGGLPALVLVEVIERESLGIDQDATELGDAGGRDDRHGALYGDVVRRTGRFGSRAIAGFGIRFAIAAASAASDQQGRCQGDDGN